MSRYGRVSYRFDVPRWGQVQLDHDSKRVEDTVPDSVYVFRAGENNNPDQPPTPDALLMADSWVHTSFVGTRFERLDSAPPRKQRAVDFEPAVGFGKLSRVSG